LFGKTLPEFDAASAGRVGLASNNAEMMDVVAVIKVVM
jgi:hypothetical protein